MKAVSKIFHRTYLYRHHHHNWSFTPTTHPRLEHKLLTNRNAAPESLGLSSQEEREIRAKWSRSKIERDVPEIDRRRKQWGGRDRKRRGGVNYKSFYERWKYTEGRGRRTTNNKNDPSASTSEERLRKIKRTTEPGVSKVEVVTTVYHMVEWKHNIVIVGEGKCISLRNEEKMGKLGSAQFLINQQRERKWRRHQIFQDWRSSYSEG